MALIDGSTGEQRLRQARTIYEEERSAWKSTFDRMQEDFDFVAGNQWPEAAKRKLLAEQRPALTFNLTQQVVAEFVGANEDVRKRMRAVPVGAEDQAVGDILDHLWRTIYNEQSMPDVEREEFENAVSVGLGNVAFDFEPMESNPTWYEIQITPLGAMEVYWDRHSRKKDYSDAQYFCWPRWVSESEFASEFPDKAKQFNDLQKMVSEPSGFDTRVDPQKIDHEQDYCDVKAFKNPEFYKLEEAKLLIVRMEYIRPVERFFVQDPEDNAWIPIERAQYQLLREAPESKDTVRKVWGREVRMIEFTGAQILFDDLSPQPLKGFSIVPIAAKFDRSDGRPYGVVRDLKDPQREINKRYSNEVDLVSRQVQPGAVIEENAVSDVEEFDRDTRTPGKTAVVRDGTLSGEKYRERAVPVVPTGVADLAQRAYENFQRVAGFMLDPLIGQRSQNEPVGTALLRHRRSLMAITPILEQFRGFQRRNLLTVISYITKLLPDDQIEAMLGNTERWTVQDGIVTDAETQKQVDIRNLQKLRWDIEMEAAADDTTASTLVFQTLAGAMQQGLPLPPDVVVDYLPIPRDQKARVRNFMKQQAAQQAKQAEAAQQKEDARVALDSQQIQDAIQVEAEKVSQRREAQGEKTETDRRDDFLDFIAQMAKIIIESDQAEKERSIQILQQGIQRAREGTRRPQPVAATVAGSAPAPGGLGGGLRVAGGAQ